jgi:hypothetical protein
MDLPPVIKKILVRGFLGLLSATVVLYIVDAVQVRVRLATGGAARAYDTVTVVYAAGLKGNKYEVYAGDPDLVTCSRSIFPQMGYSPCWYLRENTMQVID